FTATMNGSRNGVRVAGNVKTGSSSGSDGPLAAGGTIDLHFRAKLGSTLAAGTIVTNTGVVTWNTPPQTTNRSGSITSTAIAKPRTITKQVSVVGGGAAVPGATLDYLVHVTNTSANPVNPVVITDNLNAAGAGALTYVTGTATMNNSPNGVSVAGNV